MAELLNVSAEERKSITQPATDILAIAQDFKIVDADGYEAAGVRLQLVKGLQKALKVKKDSVMAPLRVAVEAARALFAEPEARLVQAEEIFKGAMLAYQRAEEVARIEAQRKLDDIARRERDFAAREAAAAAAKAEQQRQQAEEARKAGDAAEAKRLAALAEKNEVKAEAKQEVAQTVVAATVQQAPPQVGGIATRETWSALVLDPAALVKAIAAGTVPMQAFEPNMKFLNNQAKALKKDLAYPGVRAVVEKGIAARSK